jgi:hypothetical protein
MVHLTDAAADWLVHGERGLSSETIFEHMTGIPLLGAPWRSSTPRTPSDPDDFQRCERLLRQVPEFRARRNELTELSPLWAALIEHWDEITALLEEEIPGVYEGAHGRAPRTYELMKTIEDTVRDTVCG